MNRHWHFYDLETGRLLGKTLSGPDASVLASNTPAGAGAVEGHYDPLSQRVELATGAVIDYQPPQPSEDHEWVDRRWRLKKDAAAREIRRRAARKAIDAVEWKQARAVREALISVLPDGPAKQRLQQIDDEIATLRSDLS